jgi:hypothetical protein
MKVTIFTTGLVAASLFLSHGRAAARTNYRSLHATTFTYRHHAVETRRQPIELKPEITGVIPRAVRGGNPLQMLNPFAPAKYGTAEENSVLDPNITGQGDGIKLFNLLF